jgi:hypothetical protein
MYVYINTFFFTICRKKIEMSDTIISTSSHLLAIHPGKNIWNDQIDVVLRNAHHIKHSKYSSKTQRNKATAAYQVHFGKTTYPGSQVKKWFYVLDGKALTREELLALTTSQRKRIKRLAHFYDRKGSKLLEGEVGVALETWLFAAAALYKSSPERYENMMKLTEPFIADGQTISLRLVPNLPFTNGTINYVEPVSGAVSICMH